MTQSPPHEIEETLIELAREVPKLFSRVLNAVQTIHRQTDLDPRVRNILRDVVELGPTTATTLSAEKSLSPRAIARVLNQLSNQGLIAFKRSGNPTKQKVYGATEAGKHLHAKLHALEVAELSDLAREFSPSEARAALEAIRYFSKTLAMHLPRRSV